MKTSAKVCMSIVDSNITMEVVAEAHEYGYYPNQTELLNTITKLTQLAGLWDKFHLTIYSKGQTDASDDN